MLRRRPFLGIGCFIALAGLLASGCGSNTSTVVGKVTYQGKPVAGGSVIVYCPDKQIVRSTIGTDGTYSIPNVPSGQAIVTVQSPARTPAGLRMKQSLPPSSGGPIPLTVEANDPARVLIPQRYALPEESGLSVVVDRGQVTYDIDLKP
jgi:hypothetical protein